MHQLHHVLKPTENVRPKYWYCHCCLKQNTFIPGIEEALNKCVTCGRLSSYTQDGYALPMHGKGVTVYRPTQIASVLENLDEHDMFEWTALHSAAVKGNAPVVKELLELGCIVDARTKHHQTALHLAVYGGSLSSVKLLIEAGANITRVTHLEQNTPLHMAVDGNWRDIAFYLIHHGADVHAKNVMQRTPLHLAAASGRLEIGVMLLKAGAEPMATDINGWNPRQVAELNSHREFQELLIHRSVKDRQPVLKDLPEAPWHGDLWTRVMDAQHQKREDHGKSTDAARRRDEEIARGMKKLRSGARTRSVMKTDDEGLEYYVEEEYEEEVERAPAVRTLLGCGKVAEYISQRYPLARYPWTRDEVSPNLLTQRLTEGQEGGASAGASASASASASGGGSKRRRRPRPREL